MLLKVCGVHGAGAADDVRLLARTGVDLLGLWHGVPEARAELSLGELTRLAAVTRATGTVEPVLVTLEHDSTAIARVLASAGIRWVQLHAYQLPAMIARLTARLPGEVTIVKALHVTDRRCVEARLIGAYEEAGVDVFLIDAASADRVGSTGRQVPPDVALGIAAELRRPFMLAGGISAPSRPRYASLVRREGFLGVDVCSGAWTRAGRLRAANVAAIREAWGEEPAPERRAR